MRRRLVNLLWALSLLLCLTAAVMWVRSLSVADVWMHQTAWSAPAAQRGCRAVGSMRGSIWYAFEGTIGYAVLISPRHNGWSSSDLSRGPGAPLQAQYVQGFRSRWGFAYAAPLAMDQSVYERVVAIPYWFILMLTSILPAMFVVRFVRCRRRDHAGRCAACGYDLRATPDRCPECGAVPKL
jgi:hypothetical protein